MADYSEDIQSHYRSKFLPEHKLKAILSRQADLKKNRLTRFLPAFATAAVLIVGFIFLQHRLEQTNLTHNVLAEIAMNHNKQLAVEIASDRYETVQKKLSRLEFRIQPPNSSLLTNYVLLGGRYCSIQGELAAQLKLKDKQSGATFTLYVTPVTKKLQTLREQTVAFENLRIQLLKHNGRLFGLAGPK